MSICSFSPFLSFIITLCPLIYLKINNLVLFGCRITCSANIFFLHNIIFSVSSVVYSTSGQFYFASPTPTNVALPTPLHFCIPIVYYQVQLPKSFHKCTNHFNSFSSLSKSLLLSALLNLNLSTWLLFKSLSYTFK